MINKTSPQLTEKVAEVYEELRRTSLWKAEVPEWVQQYKNIPCTQVEFSEWLQFVFLPNKVQGNRTIISGGIAPQAMRFYSTEVSKGRLLQLLVELDSITE